VSTSGKNTLNEGDAIVKVAESVFIPADETVAGDVVVFGGNAIIEGKVAGSVVVMGGEIRARRGAEIKGDVVAIGGTIVEDEEVIIRGERVQVGGVATEIGDRLHVGVRAIRAFASLGIFFVALVLFFITMLFLRGKIERVGTHISTAMFKCFGVGVLSAVVGLFGPAHRHDSTHYHHRRYSAGGGAVRELHRRVRDRMRGPSYSRWGGPSLRAPAFMAAPSLTFSSASW
jgi:hypothetical protein